MFTFYVVKGVNGSLLGYPKAASLEKIEVVNSISGPKEKVEDEFLHLFKGIGKLKNHQVKIHIDTTVKTVAQKRRKTPFHLRDKVEREINELVKLDKIEKVEGVPTP